MYCAFVPRRHMCSMSTSAALDEKIDCHGLKGDAICNQRCREFWGKKPDLPMPGMSTNLSLFAAALLPQLHEKGGVCSISAILVPGGCRAPLRRVTCSCAHCVMSHGVLVKQRSSHGLHAVYGIGSLFFVCLSRWSSLFSCFFQVPGGLVMYAGAAGRELSRMILSCIDLACHPRLGAL
jgi:hypothetical protein